MMDFYDVLLAKQLSGGGGGGVAVEPLTVTENGTYTAPAGSAYSPVTVNVQAGGSDLDGLISGSLRNIVSGAQSVRPRAFYRFGSLSSINCQKATTIGDEAFSQCTGLETAYFPSATSVGERSFFGCTSMHNIDISSATKLSASALQNCRGLVTIDLPKVTNLGGQALEGCTNLKTLILRAEAVCYTPYSGFLPSNVESVYVPDAFVSAYQADTKWSAYASKIKPLSEYVG